MDKIPEGHVLAVKVIYHARGQCSREHDFMQLEASCVNFLPGCFVRIQTDLKGQGAKLSRLGIALLFGI